MDKIYIFDVDGTLTPSRLPMVQDFTIFFSLWSINNPFYLVTGSNIDKTKEQVPWYILERAKAVFTCCGNEMWVGKKQKYRKEFEPPQDLIEFLWDKVNNSICPIRIGNHIEDRKTMVNFSVVGRDCSQEQREEYYEWDKTNHERKNIAEQIKKQWPDLDAVIGGEISIDIYKKGDDKSQTFEHIKNKHTNGEFIFIGDGIENKGNDYSLAKLMDNEKNCKWYQTEGWEQTQKILKGLNG
jgi:phosphomannomutase